MLRTDLEQIRRRLRELGVTGAELARATGESPRTVQDYLAVEGREIPASFIAKLEAAGIASARWVLLEEGQPAVASPDEQGIRLRVIGRIVDGQISARTLSLLAQPELPKAIADALEEEMPSSKLPTTGAGK